MTVTIYHNPSCSKSRASLAILEQHHAAPQVINYLETPPTAAELNRLIGLLGVSVRDLLRTGEEAYELLGLAEPSLPEEALVRALVNNPILI